MTQLVIRGEISTIRTHKRRVRRVITTPTGLAGYETQHLTHIAASISSATVHLLAQSVNLEFTVARTLSSLIHRLFNSRMMQMTTGWTAQMISIRIFRSAEFVHHRVDLQQTHKTCWTINNQATVFCSKTFDSFISQQPFMGLLKNPKSVEMLPLKVRLVRVPMWRFCWSTQSHCKHVYLASNHTL